MGKRIVIGSVIYQQAFCFFEDFLKSLELQTYNDFMILLINDDISMNDIKGKILFFAPWLQEKIIIIDKSGRRNKPCELRVELIKEAYQRNYDILVLLDCDDKASSNRIECISKQFGQEYTFFYNELLDFEKRTVMPTLPNFTNDVGNIRECNYLGMSNNALNLKKLSSQFIESLYQGQTKVFDWYLFSRILLNGGVGKKVIECCTYYRIYDENIAGRSIYDKRSLNNEILVKKQHYELLGKYDVIYNDLLRKYSSISEENLKAVNANGYWWGLINSQNIV